MEHTQIINATELENYADTRDSEAVIPELVCMLVKESVADLTACRIPYGDAINQPGWDGLVETEHGYRQFVPNKKSFWEIGTGSKPQDKATEDFEKRTRKMIQQDLKEASYVFVTPRGASSGGWSEIDQSKWIKLRELSGWRSIKILDNVQLADWMREFPAIGKWLLKRIGIVKTTTGFATPAEHWDNLEQLTNSGDPPLPSKLFLVGREKACEEVMRLFNEEIKLMALVVESEQDTEDFIAAFLASLEVDKRRIYCNRCIFVKDADAWNAMANLKNAHVLVAHPQLDLESSGEQLHMLAKKKGHGVIIPVSSAWASEKLIPLRSPSASMIETTLRESGYSHERARKLAGAGALSLAALKRYLRGLGDLPPYATWSSARLLAQAGLLGRWSGENPADKATVETVVGKSYGEWIETVRSETLRSDTPLTQRNENWKMISRGEAWSGLGPRLCNDDLDRFKRAAIEVLRERDPKFDLPAEERFAASLYKKNLLHSESIRKGMAETLALLGSRPTVLSSCSQEKAELVATLTVRELLKGADWIMWASLDRHLPMLAEAAPDEFLGSVEAALAPTSESPFKGVFAQERSGAMSCNYMSGLLWALETLAWHPEYLARVTMVLGDLAAIDPGGNWSNRPANSLAAIFLPWYPQTCATIPKRKATVEALLREQPSVGWKLLMALLPTGHGLTTDTSKPSWRDFILPEWTSGATTREYWEQVVGYSELVVTTAATDLTKLTELVNRLSDLPKPAYLHVLNHLASENVLSLPESVRLPLWEALKDLAAKHRKFANAQWAIPREAVAKIEETAAKIEPKSAGVLYRRLFSERDFDLFEENGNYDEQRQKLDLRRQAAVKEILEASQILGVWDFAQQVDSPRKVGHALGCLASAPVDNALLPSYLSHTERIYEAFIRGFVWGRFAIKSWAWVDNIVMEAWTAEQKATFFTFLPFGQETWRRVGQLLASGEAIYWKKADVHSWISPEHLQEAAEKLLQYHRPYAAVTCLNWLIHNKTDFSPQLATRALLDSLNTEDKTTGLDHYEALELIKWLQENPATNLNDLFQIEWAYLPLLDRLHGAIPKTLEKRLATDFVFFHEVIRIVFRSDKQTHLDQHPTEKEKNIAQNAYRLLHTWKTVPGSNNDGSFNETEFKAWLAAVKELAASSGHLRIAMDQIGKVLPYAPPDADGLWINHSVAETLDAKDASEMRSAFTCELFNMRGVHGFSAGKEELKIATGYREKAEALDQRGYLRFAAAMRKIAEQYEREAERDSQRDPFED